MKNKSQPFKKIVCVFCFSGTIPIILHLRWNIYTNKSAADLAAQSAVPVSRHDLQIFYRRTTEINDRVKKWGFDFFQGTQKAREEKNAWSYMINRFML